MSQDRPFTQVILSEEQLREGLAADVDHVHIPSEAIATTELRAADLSEMLGISFQESFDELDEGSFAVLRFDTGFMVTLKDYRSSPVKGAKICTDPAGRYSRRRLEDIMSGLGIPWGRLTWITLGLK